MSLSQEVARGYIEPRVWRRTSAQRQTPAQPSKEIATLLMSSPPLFFWPGHSSSSCFLCSPCFKRKKWFFLMLRSHIIAEYQSDRVLCVWKWEICLVELWRTVLCAGGANMARRRCISCRVESSCHIFVLKSSVEIDSPFDFVTLWLKYCSCSSLKGRKSYWSIYLLPGYDSLFLLFATWN